MSYLVLARKWRPQLFCDVIGQEHVTSTLKNALSENKLAHALLFSGPRGVGKTTVARILAKALNCEKGTLPEPCNSCGSCQEITSGASVDVQEIDGASNRGIDEIRELRESVKFQPVRCKVRVYIIDEVHMLTKEAFNALLKTLEEPPDHVFFVFATTEPRRIPATIHSRCQHYEFHRLSTEILANHLKMIVQKEGLGLDESATKLLAREAEGSVRDSLSLLDQVAAYGAKNSDQVCQALGLARLNTLAEIALAVMNGSSGECLKIVDRFYELGGDVNKLASELVTFFRNLAVIIYVPGEEAQFISGLDMAEVNEYRKRFATFSKETVLQIFDALLRGQEGVFKSPSPRFALELMLIRLCSMKNVESIDSLIEKITEMGKDKDSVLLNGHIPPEKMDSQALVIEEKELPQDKKESFTAARPEVKKATAEQANKHIDASNQTVKIAGEVSKELLKEDGSEFSSSSKVDSDYQRARDWDNFINFLKNERSLSALTFSLIEACELESISKTTGKVQLSCSGEAQCKMILDDDRRLELEKLISDYFGTTFKLEVCYSNNMNFTGTGQKKTLKIEDELKGHPFVRETLKIFNARISYVKPLAKYNQKRSVN